MTAVNNIGSSNQSVPSYHMMTLREVPSGKPTITAAHNLRSAQSILMNPIHSFGGLLIDNYLTGLHRVP